MAKITFFVGTDADCYGVRKLNILMQEPEMFVLVRPCKHSKVTVKVVFAV